LVISNTYHSVNNKKHFWKIFKLTLSYETPLNKRMRAIIVYVWLGLMNQCACWRLKNQFYWYDYENVIMMGTINILRYFTGIWYQQTVTQCYQFITIKCNAWFRIITAGRWSDAWVLGIQQFSFCCLLRCKSTLLRSVFWIPSRKCSKCHTPCANFLVWSSRSVLVWCIVNPTSWEYKEHINSWL